MNNSNDDDDDNDNKNKTWSAPKVPKVNKTETLAQGSSTTKGQKRNINNASGHE